MVDTHNADGWQVYGDGSMPCREFDADYSAVRAVLIAFQADGCVFNLGNGRVRVEAESGVLDALTAYIEGDRGEA